MQDVKRKKGAKNMISVMENDTAGKKKPSFFKKK